MKSQTRGLVWVLICVILWSLIPIVSKTGQQKLDNHQFLFWSSLISCLVLFVTSLARGQFRLYSSLSVRQFGRLFILGLLGTYIYYLFLYLGYAAAGGMEVLVVQYTWPVLIMLLSVFILGERLGLKKIGAGLLGFTGVLFVLTKGDFNDIHFSNLRVILLVFLGAFSFALFSVLSKREETEPLIATTVYFFAALLSSFLSMLIFSGFQFPSAAEVLPVLTNGVLVNGFSYLFWIFALKSTSASFTAPFTFLAPVLSAVYLVLFFSEPFLPAYAAGLLLVLGAGLLNTLPLGRKKDLS